MYGGVCLACLLPTYLPTSLPAFSVSICDGDMLCSRWAGGQMGGGKVTVTLADRHGLCMPSTFLPPVLLLLSPLYLSILSLFSCWAETWACCGRLDRTGTGTGGCCCHLPPFYLHLPHLPTTYLLPFPLAPCPTTFLPYLPLCYSYLCIWCFVWWKDRKMTVTGKWWLWRAGLETGDVILIILPLLSCHHMPSCSV